MSAGFDKFRQSFVDMLRDAIRDAVLPPKPGYEAREISLEVDDVDVCDAGAIGVNSWIISLEEASALLQYLDTSAGPKTPWEPIDQTDGGHYRSVLAAVRVCARAWQPEVRILGNVRAADVVRAIDAVEMLDLPVWETAASYLRRTTIAIEDISAKDVGKVQEYIADALDRGADESRRTYPRLGEVYEAAYKREWDLHCLRGPLGQANDSTRSQSYQKGLEAVYNAGLRRPVPKILPEGLRGHWDPNRLMLYLMESESVNDLCVVLNSIDEASP